MFSSRIPNLETIFRENRLSDVAATTFPPIHEQRKAFTDNALMGLEESCAMFTAREKTSELGTTARPVCEDGDGNEEWGEHHGGSACCRWAETRIECFES